MAIHDAPSVPDAEEWIVVSQDTERRTHADTRRALIEDRHVVLCLRCHALDYPRSKARGSIGLMIALWIVGMFVWPVGAVALVYTLWFIFHERRKVCHECDSEELVPASSEVARRVLADSIRL